MNYTTNYFIDTYIDNVFFSRSESFFNKELCKVKFRHLSNSLNTTNPHKSPYFSLKLKALIDLDEFEKYSSRPGIFKSPFTYKLPVSVTSTPSYTTSNVNTGSSFVMSNLNTRTSPVVSKTTTTTLSTPKTTTYTKPTPTPTPTPKPNYSNVRSKINYPVGGINPFAFGFLPAAAKEMIVKQQGLPRKEKGTREQVTNNTNTKQTYGVSPFGFGVIPNNIKELSETQKKKKKENKESEKAIEMAQFLGRQFMPKNDSVTTNTETTINSSNSSNNCSNSESDDNDSDDESMSPLVNYSSEDSSISNSGESSSISNSGKSSSSLSSEGSYISSDISGDEVNSTNPSFIDMAASLFISQTST